VLIGLYNIFRSIAASATRSTVESVDVNAITVHSVQSLTEHSSLASNWYIPLELKI